MGNLYIVATPIGNLQDISLRALKTLREVDFIACEDTRIASILIKKFFEDNQKEMYDKVFSYYEEIELKKNPQIMNLLKNGKNVALISDAGTPAIADPGFKLIRTCITNGIKVISIPGPSSIISALVSSGLPTDKFTFLGFLPQKPGHRLTLLKNVKKSQNIISTTLVIFESPYKIHTTLKDIRSVFGNIEITIARELTKIHEEVKKDNIGNFISVYEKNPPRGELVILFNLK